MNKHFIKALTLISIFPILTSCGSYEEYNGKYYGFGTLYEVRLFEGSNQDLKPISNIIEDYSALCDNYDYFDNINNVNSINNAEGFIKVDNKLIALLKKSLEYSKLLGGYFNPLMGKLNKLWKENLQNPDIPSIPSDDLVQKYLNEVKTSELIIDEENSQVMIKGAAEIDLGAVAKGYSLDVITDYLKTKKITKYLINGGSSSLALGVKPGDKDFIIGINEIQGKYFKGHDEFVSTSSLSNQGVTIDDITYSHIINPFTGSAITKHDFVLVKGTEESGLLDAMSTAFSCMELIDIKPYEEQFDIDILIYDDGKITYQSKDMEVMDY